MEVDILMSREVGANWKEWTPSTWKGHSTIKLSCRQVTPAYQCTDSLQPLPVVEITDDLDPHGVISSMVASGGYYVLEENVITFQKYSDHDK